MFPFANSILLLTGRIGRVLATPALLLLMLAGGCASLPTDYRRTESTALEDDQSTTIAQRWATAEA